MPDVDRPARVRVTAAPPLHDLSKTITIDVGDEVSGTISTGAAKGKYSPYGKSIYTG
jgi:hypothetical protein